LATQEDEHYFNEVRTTPDGISFGKSIIGGIYWYQTSSTLPNASDDISVNWYVRPQVKERKAPSWLLVTVEEGWSQANQDSFCLAKALQFSEGRGFRGLVAVSDEEFCSSESRLFRMGDPAPSGSPTLWSTRVDGLRPVDPFRPQAFKCVTATERQQCGKTLAQKVSATLEATLGKEKPLYVRFLSTVGYVYEVEVSPEGNLKVYSAYWAAQGHQLLEAVK
jgi:hypothetical protein